MNLPNAITIFRIILAPVMAVVLVSDLPQRNLYGFLILALAGISDVLDGYLARSYNQRTKLGTALDPLADKLMLFCALYALYLRGALRSWIFYFMTAKEAMMVIVGSVLYLIKGRYTIPANKFGKLATAVFYAAVVFALIFDSKYREFLFMLMLIVSVIAGLNYAIILFKNLGDGKKKA